MNGHEHFLEAEMLLERSHRDEDPWKSEGIAQAQVHATLALAWYTAKASHQLRQDMDR